MKIKRYTARDMRQAMQKVREDQGPDAVILSTRRSDGMVEIIAAIDYDEALVREAVEPYRSAPAAIAPSSTATAATVATIADAALTVPADLIAMAARRTAAAAARSKAPPVAAPRTPSAPMPAAATVAKAPSAPMPAPPVPVVAPVAATAAEVVAIPPSAAPASAPNPNTPAQYARATLEAGADRVRMHDEIGQLRHLLETQLSSLAWNDLDRRQPRRAGVLRDLTRFGIEADVAADIVEDLPATLSRQQSRYLPLGLISRRLRVNPAADEPGGAVALVGATGAGKTTTLAKLAARHVQRRGRHSVALIGTDDYRVGAHDQLLHYGRALGVQTFTATDADELARLLVHLAGCELVLIDTPGLAVRDARLPSVVDMLKTNAERVRPVLVLPANVQAGSLEHSVRAYAALDPVSCILTKLDEACTLGGALSVAIRHGLALEFVTHGQRVPEDIAVADPRRLVCRLADTVDTAAPDEIVMAERFGRAALATS